MYQYSGHDCVSPVEYIARNDKGWCYPLNIPDPHRCVSEECFSILFINGPISKIFSGFSGERVFFHQAIYVQELAVSD